jgi:methyl-accepting chemotaxis protein
MPKGKKPSLQDVLDEVRANQEQIRGHGVILEEMRSQNRATIEAVETIRVTVDQRIDRFEHATQDRFTVLEVAVRQNSADIRKNGEAISQNSEELRQNTADIRQNSADIRQNTTDIRQNSEDIRTLSAGVDALGSLDRRVSALERRVSGEG